MSNITITNRQAVLDLINAADETSEITLLENKLNDLEGFISVDVPSGVATFSASGTINISSTDGTITSTQTLTPNDVTTLVDTTTGTPGAYDATLIDIKGELRVQILDDSLSSFFNIANDIVIYFPSDDSTFNPIDIDQIKIIGPSAGFPNGITQLNLNGAQGISNTFVGEQCFVITPALGGAGTETIPSTTTSTITLNNSQVLLNRTKDLSFTNEIDISDNSIVLSSTDGTNESSVAFGVDGTISILSTDGTNTGQIDTLKDGSINISSTDGTNTSQIEMLVDTLSLISGTINIFSTDGTDNAAHSISPTAIFTIVDSGTDVGFFTVDKSQVFSSVTDGTNTSTETITPITITSTVTDGVDTNSITLTPTNLNISNLPAFDDDTDASTLSTGDLYQTTGLGASPLDVAGILMIKQ